MHPDNAIRSSSSHPSAFNALKHGFYAESVVLPGEDAAQFRRERRMLFHTYRPQTKDEADLVDAMAGHRWVGRRLSPVQAWFDEQAVTPETDAAGRICEPIAHQRLHSGMDVTVHCQRVEKQWHRARAWLVAMQKQRRQGLVAGAVALPKDCYMETDGRVYGPVAQPKIVPIPEPDIEAENMEVSLSTDGQNGKYQEPQETGRVAVPTGYADGEAAGITSPPMASGGHLLGRFKVPGAFAEARGTAAVGGRTRD